MGDGTTPENSPNLNLPRKKSGVKRPVAGGRFPASTFVFLIFRSWDFGIGATALTLADWPDGRLAGYRPCDSLTDWALAD